MIKLKRAYDEPNKSDGYRILVDRLWPRGIKKENAKIDLWEKDIAPSTELRQWFHHEPDKWDEFRTRYMEELQHKWSAVDRLKQTIHARKEVTLIYSAKDEEHNNAVVLRDYLDSMSKAS